MIDKEPQRDTLVVDGVGTPDEKLWITIKDASDLLGCSERHMWRVVQKNIWETKKQLNISRKKTYILRSDVEMFYKAEKERRRLEALKGSSSDTSDISDKDTESDMSDKSSKLALSEMSDKKRLNSLPMILSEYKQTILDYQTKQEKLIGKAAFWKTSAIWILIAAFIVTGTVAFWLSDTRVSLSDMKTAMSDIKSNLSIKERALSDSRIALSESNIALSDSQKALSDKRNQVLLLERATKTKTNALDSMKEINQGQAAWIATLENNISKKRLNKLKTVKE